jgi:hypothetical protein
MAKLEAILNNLTKKPGTNQISDNYSTKTLVEAMNYTKEFLNLDMKTAEGQTKYEEAGLPKQEHILKTEELYKNACKHLQVLTTNYIDKNIKTIISQTPEEQATELAYQFLPQQKSENKKYEKVRTTMQDQETKIQEIQKDPEKYITTQIKNAPKWMQGFIALNPKRTIEIDTMIAQNKALEEISKYGATKFLQDSYKHQVELEKPLIETLEKANKKRSELEAKMPETMHKPQEIANYFKEVDTELTNANKKLAEIQMTPKIKQTLVGITINEFEKKTAADDYNQEEKAAA